MISLKKHRLMTSAFAGVLALVLAIAIVVPPAYALEDAARADSNSAESGTTEGEKVEVCKHVSNDGVVTKEPSCSAEGEKTYSCTECGQILQIQSIPALNHVPSEEGKIVRQPTHYDVGQINYYCTICGELVFAKAIPMLPWDAEQPEEPVSPTPSPDPTPLPNPSPNPDVPTTPPSPTIEPIEPPVPHIPGPCENHEWVSDGEMQYCKKCNQINHYHNFSQNLRYNEIGHWRECLVTTCGQRKNFSEHEWVERHGRVECRVCRYVKHDIVVQPTPAPIPPETPQVPPVPNKENQYRLSPTQAPMHTVHGQVTGPTTLDAPEEGNEIKEQAATPAPTQQPQENVSSEKQHMGITVPIFFENAEFNENGNCFVGNLNFQTDKSAPVEIQDVELIAEKKWKLVAYEGEDEIGKKQISAVINRCPSVDGGFDFNPKYFTVPIPQNGLLELPFKVCVRGPEWTSSKEAPLKIVAHIGAAS